MSFVPGWYIVRYGDGPDDETKIIGFCSLSGWPIVEGKPFLLVEDNRPNAPFRLLIRFDLVKTLEAIPNPVEPAPDVKYTKRATERVESTFPPAATPRPFIALVDWSCGQCGHPLGDHGQVGGQCAALVFTTTEEPFMYDGKDCSCRVNPAALAAFFALDAPARLAGIQAAWGWVTKEKQAPPELFCKSCDHTLEEHSDPPGAGCCVAGCSCPSMESKMPIIEPVMWSAGKCPDCEHPWLFHCDDGNPCAWEVCYCTTQKPDPLTAFAHSLDEARADILRECEASVEDPKPWPPFRTCLDCGCPWIWHEAVLGRRCAGLNCECAVTRGEAARFVEEADQEQVQRVERNVL